MSAEYEQWCEQHGHDPYSPLAARHFAGLMNEAEREYQEWMELEGR